MTGRLQETLEETQRRLALGGVTTAPMMQTRDTPPRRSGNTAGIVIAVIVLVVVAAVVALAAIGSSVDEPADPTVKPGAVGEAPDWTAYPGNAYVDPAVILAAPPLGQVVERSRILTENITSDLTADYGFEWRPYTDEREIPYPNAYGGDSMLVSYQAAQWQGTVVLDDPAARADIVARIETWGRQYGLDRFQSQNALAPDDAWARQQYGATLPADQPLWSVYAPSTDVSGFSLQYSVLDTGLPADPTFVGGSWFDTDSDAAAGVLHVSLEVYGDTLLDESLRADFERELEPYAGFDRPDPLDLG